LGRSPLDGARVLILEDEYLLADDLVRALCEKGAQPVGPVSSVKDAEDLLSREWLDAAILDVNLHGQMASDFIRRLAASKLPCLIVSGYSEEALPEAVSGITRLEKPVSTTLILETLAVELARIMPA
jgi:DNA-binding response OmpR family regulator